MTTTALPFAATPTSALTFPNLSLPAGQFLSPPPLMSTTLGTSTFGYSVSAPAGHAGSSSGTVVGFNGIVPHGMHGYGFPTPASATSTHQVPTLGYSPTPHPGTIYHQGGQMYQMGVVSIASSITIKLSSENYLVWRAQVGPLLRSQLLMGYVDGSNPCPASHVVVSHGDTMVQQPNPAYHHWVQQDQAILSAFVSSMTKSVVGMVMFVATAREAWETLSGVFASTSIVRSSSICQQMAELKKDNKSTMVYFHQMKALVDSLTNIGQPLRPEEFISYILAGLDSDYDALHGVFTTRTTPMPIQDLFAQLVSTEQRMLARHGASAATH
jgi:hypothetical protein